MWPHVLITQDLLIIWQGYADMLARIWVIGLHLLIQPPNLVYKCARILTTCKIQQTNADNNALLGLLITIRDFVYLNALMILRLMGIRHFLFVCILAWEDNLVITPLIYVFFSVLQHLTTLVILKMADVFYFAVKDPMHKHHQDFVLQTVLDLNMQITIRGDV